MRKIFSSLFILLSVGSLHAQPSTDLSRYDFFYAGESVRQQMFKVEGGRVTWHFSDPQGRGEISDAVLLSDGHILMAHQHGIKEIAPIANSDKEGANYTVIWQKEAPRGYEIHSIQPIGQDKVVYVQCGDPMQAVVMEIPSLKEIKRINLPFRDGGSHGQMRNFRLTRRGTLLLAHMQFGLIMEFDDRGRELRRWPMPGAWGVEELANGNILACSNQGFAREFDRQGAVVWDFNWRQQPGGNDVSPQKAHRLPNGNTLINNWFNEWGGKPVDRQNPPVQAIEVTPDGKIVWELRSWNEPADLGPSTTIQLLSEPVDRNQMHWGKDSDEEHEGKPMTPRHAVRPVSLVPSAPSSAPDYFCTWNVQGYVTSYKSSEAMREAMNEANVLGMGAFQRWVRFFPEIRQDLLLVLDDSWDIPADCNDKNNGYIGMLELDTTRFPSFTGSPVARMRQLADSVERCGWRGLGLWVSAQKAKALEGMDEDLFWTKRLSEAEASHVRYWKVDWGRRDRDDVFRRQLAEKARELAPNLVLENAMKDHYVTFSDAFRTYDVENIVAQPVTIERVCRLLAMKAEATARGIVNCEDEPYIAVGLGCAIGIMRHPFAGTLPDGRGDEAFPATVRDLKRRLDEVIRAVRWHRIAEPFGVDGDCQIDTVRLHDFWTYHQGESWVNHREGEAVRAEAPARISRRMPLPNVASSAEDRPYVLASRYPNGATAVAAIGRTLDRSYVSCPVAVSVDIEDWRAPVGLFGALGDVTLRFAELPKGAKLRVMAQDLKADVASDITSACRFRGNTLTVPAAVIRRIGLAAASPGDLSDPGLVMRVEERDPKSEK